MNEHATGSYDRRAASRILAGLAGPGLFGPLPDLEPVRVEYRCRAVTPEPGSHLTVSQRLYLERFMRPCRPDQVTVATHRMTWTDSAGVPNTGHYRDDGFGPVVPVVARETVLELWAALAAESGLAARISASSADDRAVLAGTTTDHDPIEIFRVGIEACGRVVAQHALLGGPSGYRDPADFVAALRDHGIFTAVATRWFWELQASTYRRGMIAVAFAPDADGALRYTADTVATLAAMKEATIADAHAVMHRATTTEGLEVEAAIAKYHDDLDLISRQYALLPPGTQPACLAAMSHRIDGGQTTLLPIVVDEFVARFTANLARVTLTERPAGAADASDESVDGVFAVPDMNCRHCVRTITAVVESMSITVVDIDLVSKRVVADFRSPRNRERAFEALRDGGYNPAPLTVETELEPGAGQGFSGSEPASADSAAPDPEASRTAAQPLAGQRIPLSPVSNSDTVPPQSPGRPELGSTAGTARPAVESPARQPVPQSSVSNLDAVRPQSSELGQSPGTAEPAAAPEAR